METKNRYDVYCLDEYNTKTTVIVMADNKDDAKERVLTNHPEFEVTAVLSQEEIKAINDK